MLERVLYWKTCLNCANSHIGAVRGVIDVALLLGLYLKVTGGGIAGTVALGWMGHLDIKHGIADKETSINNRFNPELQRLLKEREA